MKSRRHIAILVLVLLAGGAVTALLDWERERSQVARDAANTVERLATMVSLCPVGDADQGMRRLLSKTLVEQSGMAVAYLIVDAPDGQESLSIGDVALSLSAGEDAGGVDAVHRFSAPDGSGEIVAFREPLLHGSRGQTVALGLRVPSTPLVSASRLSSMAAVVFFMLAAVIAGYYTICLSVRHFARAASIPSGTGADAAAGSSSESDSVLLTMERMNSRLTSIHAELQQTHELNAQLSSRLGVASFEARQAYRVLDGLDSGILILDPQDRIRHVNAAMLRMLGGEKAAIEGRPYAEVITNGDVRRLLDARQDGPNQLSSGIDAQFEETAPDRTYHLDCQALVDGSGDAIGTLLTAQDITRLVRAHLAQEDFIAEVTHELLTPLTSIKGYADMLASGGVDDEAMQREFYNTINSETDRLAGLIQNLLNVARMEAGSMTIERSLIKTDWLLDQCMPAVDAAAGKKQISIEKRLPDTFPTIMGDKELLKVVLVNVLGNAVKYTPEGGTVRVSMVAQDHSVFFEVSDTGCGIPPADQERVFEKFYRGSSSDVREQVGSGLGLATAMHITTLHGGTITLESELDKGSCFTVRIPAEDYSLENQ